MRRIFNLLCHNLLVVFLGCLVLPASSAQNATPSQDTEKGATADRQNSAPAHDTQQPPPTEQNGISTVDPAAKPATSSNTSPSNAASLTLGPGDEVEVAVYGAPDLSAHTRITSDGNVSLPLVGYVHVAGLTSSEA
jgi:protein involved in polysaccharide export with SLBB domain